MLEANIDDMNPEIYSYLIPKLLESKALDVFLTNIIMKKNRPGVKISVLCENSISEVMEDILFFETTTLGIRKTQVDRVKLKREFIKINTKYGIVNMKVAYKDNKIIKYAPEYEELKEIAVKYEIPLKKIYEQIMAYCYENIKNI